MVIHHILLLPFLFCLYLTSLKEPERFSQDAIQPAPLKNTRWILRKEFDTFTQAYIDLPVADTLQFLNQGLKFNGKLIGSYTLDNEKHILSIMLNGKSQPAFALYKIDSAYHYRYTLDNEDHLQLTPLDEREGDSLITVEGKALLLKAL